MSGAGSAEEVPPEVFSALRAPCEPLRAVPARMRSGCLLLVLAALAAGCGLHGGPDSGTSSGGTRSGGTSSDGGSGEICEIATLGYAGPWGAGNVFTDWLRSKSSQGTTSLEGSVLTSTLLAPYQVIVVQDVRTGSAGQAGVGQGIGRAYTADEVEALRQWVAQGGGLMTLIGYADPSEIDNVNRLLSPYGLSYGSTQILAGGGGYTVPVTHWADHPLAANVARVGVDNGYAVEGGGTLIAWEPTAGQYDVARAVESGSGHVFAWGDEWITYNSEWTGKPDYQVARFWANALTWLARSYGCQVPLPPGEW